MLIAFVYFFFLMASYFILRPLRDTMGTVYGVAHLQELFTGTFIVSFIVAPIYAGFASRIRLATFLPWVYGFIALTMVGFYLPFRPTPDNRWIAAAFYVWLSHLQSADHLGVLEHDGGHLLQAPRPSGCSASSPPAARSAPSRRRPSSPFSSRRSAPTPCC